MESGSEFPKDGEPLRPSDEDHGGVASQDAATAGRREGQRDEMEQREEARRPRVSVKDRRKLREGDEFADVTAAGLGSQKGGSDGAGAAEQLNQARAEAASHLDDLRRLKAEFDNYRKRVLKEQTALVEAASGTMIARLLGVLDNFDLAISAAEETRDFDKMLKGVEMVYGELREVLRTEGLEPLEAKNKPFDPNLHEAALEVPGDDSGHLVVSEVLRPGYVYKGRVLRPAMVKVTQKKRG